MEEYHLLRKQECDVRSVFWKRYTDLIRHKVIPYQWNILNDRISDAEASHAIDNFRIAAGQMEGSFYGEVFQDSDVSKWLEAVGNTLLLEADPVLEEQADSVIEIIAKAQEENGYLNTYFTIEEPDKKWSNVLECHELYCAGHFIEGAVSYYRATGKERVLQIVVKLADYLCDVFGPETGKLHGYPGHQEVELALIKLFDLTENEDYLKLARYFIDTRGTNDFFEQEFEKRDRICFWTKAKTAEPNRWYNQFPYQYYNQFHQPVRKQTEAVGHAVRGVYMYAAMADLAGRTNDEQLFTACRTIWSDIINHQMYITGGIGSTPSGEAFTAAYDLPNDTNYSETCASIGLMFFAQAMLKSEVHRTYGDTIERALYNTVLAGMNYEGNRFFYVNPLAVVPENCYNNPERRHVKPVRQKWFGCACCPPNIARTLPGLWEYIYTARKDSAFVHLFIGSEARISMDSGILEIKQKTEYPWEDRICFDVKSETSAAFELNIRIPEWSDLFTVWVDGEQIIADVKENGYITIRRDFSKGAEIILTLDLKPKLMQSNQRVHYNGGRVAITRGPLIYCIEEADNGKYLNQIALAAGEPLKEKKTDLFSGTVLVEAKGYRHRIDGRDDRLYLPYQEREEEINITALPYFLWNNRQAGEMQVWIRSR